MAAQGFKDGNLCLRRVVTMIGSLVGALFLGLACAAVATISFGAPDGLSTLIGLAVLLACLGLGGWKTLHLRAAPLRDLSDEEVIEAEHRLGRDWMGVAGWIPALVAVMLILEGLTVLVVHLLRLPGNVALTVAPAVGIGGYLWAFSKVRPRPRGYDRTSVVVKQADLLERRIGWARLFLMVMSTLVMAIQLSALVVPHTFLAELGTDPSVAIWAPLEVVAPALICLRGIWPLWMRPLNDELNRAIQARSFTLAFCSMALGAIALQWAGMAWPPIAAHSLLILLWLGGVSVAGTYGWLEHRAANAPAVSQEEC